MEDIELASPARGQQQDTCKHLQKEDNQRDLFSPDFALRKSVQDIERMTGNSFKRNEAEAKGTNNGSLAKV